MENSICKNNECAGCKACIEKCPKKCIVLKDNLSNYKALIKEEECINCGICKQVCPILNHEGLKKPIEVKQGWSINEEIRTNASSGGIATALTVSFLYNGGKVYSCMFKNGEFCIDNVTIGEDIIKLQGSKYVKSSIGKTYKKIMEDLKDNYKVLFIGLPCQVKAVQNFVGLKLQKNLYTVDLICHGTSPKYILECFLKSYGINLLNIDNIKFRSKDRFGIKSNFRILNNEDIDDYSKAFLRGISYTENCFICPFAQINRSGDITIGDSWGSELSKTEQEKGISLILIQTQKGLQLINKSEIHLESVNLDRAIEFNHQLREPTKKPKRYDIFWKGIKKGRSLRIMMLRCYPKDIINEILKRARKSRGVFVKRNI